MRWRGHFDPGYHGAYRESRYPFRRQYLRISGTDNLREDQASHLVDYTGKLARSLHVIGLINIQFIVYQDEVYVIEVNPRSSRTVPYISKVTGIPIVDLASRVILGAKIRDLGFEPGLAPDAGYLAIKMPVFSFEKISWS